LIHEISGEVLPYMQLAQLLEDAPVYGLQAGPPTLLASEVSAESLADTYLKEIRCVQARGPYRIAGWSFGGTLAYEIARQLLSSGERVSFLGLVDCAVGGRHGNPADESDVSLFARYYLQILGIELTWQIAEELQATATLQQALELCRHRGYLTSAHTFELVAARLLELRKFIAAGSAYRPSPLPVEVHYFAADRPGGRHDAGGWEEVLENRLAMSTVGGDHFTILKQPHVARLAALMNEALERSEKLPGQRGEKRAVA
jgi:thioesterase domain-containing protein